MITGPVRPANEGEWRPRPWLARLVRWSLNLFVISSAAASSVVVGYALPPWRGWAMLGRAVVLLATAVVTAAAAERVTRRFLPLSLLLELSVSVPDQLPGRFRVALRAARVRDVNSAVLGAADGSDDPEGPLAKTLVLLGALTAHDRRTRGHCERVRALNDLMADELGFSPEDRERLAWAALLHDIGKLHVPASVLQKPGALDQAEWQALQAHPHLGARIVEPLRHWLGDWADAVGHHHERWDGTGYPHGLSGEQISYGGRIIALVDAFEVMTSARPYKRPISPEAARNELVRCAGEQFDPAMVRAFLNISIGKLRRVIGPLAWLAQLPVVGGASRVEALAVAATRQGVAGTTVGAGAMAFSTAVTMGALSGATAPAAAANAHAGPAVSLTTTVAAARPKLGEPVGTGSDDAEASLTTLASAAASGFTPNGRHGAGVENVDTNAHSSPPEDTQAATTSDHETEAAPADAPADARGHRYDHPTPMVPTVGRPASPPGLRWAAANAPAVGRRARNDNG